MTRPVYSDDYMGRRFDLLRCNCWHLVRDVWRDMTGVDLGDLTPAKTSDGDLTAAASEASAGPSFQRLEQRREPCIALLSRPRDMPHVGVMLRGKLLHMTSSGVLYQPVDEVAREFSTVEFYVPRSARSEAA